MTPGVRRPEARIPAGEDAYAPQARGLRSYLPIGRPDRGERRMAHGAILPTTGLQPKVHSLWSMVYGLPRYPERGPAG